MLSLFAIFCNFDSLENCSEITRHHDDDHHHLAVVTARKEEKSIPARREEKSRMHLDCLFFSRLLSFLCVEGLPPHRKDACGVEQVSGYRGGRRDNLRLRDRGRVVELVQRSAREGYPPHGGGRVLPCRGGTSREDIRGHGYADRLGEQVRAREREGGRQEGRGGEGRGF